MILMPWLLDVAAGFGKGRQSQGSGVSASNLVKVLGHHSATSKNGTSNAAIGDNNCFCYYLSTDFSSLTDTVI